MLYTIIKYVSASIFLIIGRHSTNGGYIEPNITIDQDIDCGDAYNDTCIINCALNFDEANWTTARIPHVYCGNTTKCVIHCSANYCLRDSYILAHHTTDLDILSRQRMFPILSIISITINGSSFTNSTIHCPQSSPLSPSCIINADDAQSTEHRHTRSSIATMMVMVMVCIHTLRSRV
eukprot:431976_1